MSVTVTLGASTLNYNGQTNFLYNNFGPIGKVKKYPIYQTFNSNPYPQDVSMTIGTPNYFVRVYFRDGCFQDLPMGNVSNQAGWVNTTVGCDQCITDISAAM